MKFARKLSMENLCCENCSERTQIKRSSHGASIFVIPCCADGSLLALISLNLPSLKSLMSLSTNQFAQGVESSTPPVRVLRDLFQSNIAWTASMCGNWWRDLPAEHPWHSWAGEVQRHERSVHEAAAVGSKWSWSSWLRRVLKLGAAIGTSGELQLRATVKRQFEVSFTIERGGTQVASIGWWEMLESFLCWEDEITRYFIHGVVHSAHFYVKMIGLEL